MKKTIWLALAIFLSTSLTSCSSELVPSAEEMKTFNNITLQATNNLVEATAEIRTMDYLIEEGYIWAGSTWFPRTKATASECLYVKNENDVRYGSITCEIEFPQIGTCVGGFDFDSSLGRSDLPQTVAQLEEKWWSFDSCSALTANIERTPMSEPVKHGPEAIARLLLDDFCQKDLVFNVHALQTISKGHFWLVTDIFAAIVPGQYDTRASLGIRLDPASGRYSIEEDGAGWLDPLGCPALVDEYGDPTGEDLSVSAESINLRLRFSKE
jgi:hypothetical protein